MSTYFFVAVNEKCWIMKDKLDSNFLDIAFVLSKVWKNTLISKLKTMHFKVFNLFFLLLYETLENWRIYIIVKNILQENCLCIIFLIVIKFWKFQASPETGIQWQKVPRGILLSAKLFDKVMTLKITKKCQVQFEKNWVKIQINYIVKLKFLLFGWYSS